MYTGSLCIILEAKQSLVDPIDPLDSGIHCLRVPTRSTVPSRLCGAFLSLSLSILPPSKEAPQPSCEDASVDITMSGVFNFSGAP